MFLSQALSRARRRLGVLAARVGLAEGAWGPSGGLLVGGGAGSGARRRRPPCGPRRRRTARVARIRWTTQVGTMESGQDRPGRPRAGRSARRIPPRASLSSGGAPSTISTPRPRPGWPIRRTRGALQGGPLLVPWGPDPQATCSGAVHAPHPRRCGFGRPRHPVVGADLDADRVEVDHRVEGHPEAGAATFMTAPAHRVGDLGGSSPCPGTHADGGPRYLVGGPGWSGAGPAAAGMMSCPCT